MSSQPPHTTVWYTYLTRWQQELVDTSAQLLQFFQTGSTLILPDFSCVVFPMGKAYEGFLKQYFLDLGLITQELYLSRRFRVGRAFNPDIHPSQRDQFWLYDDVVRVCGQTVARELWNAWLVGRNQVFHYFPNEKGKLSLKEAGERLEVMSEAMAGAVQCRIDLLGNVAPIQSFPSTEAAALTSYNDN